jgi:hypothetical protein
MCIKGQSAEQLVENKVNANALTFVLILLLTLYMFRHNDTSLSKWIAPNSNMDPYCVLKSFKMHKSSK